MGQPHSPETQELLKVLQGVDKEQRSEDDSKLLLTAARAAVGRLSFAWEQVWQATVTDPVKLAAMRSLIFMNPFERWSEEEWAPKTAAELTLLCKCNAEVDANLLSEHT